jgi:hypothetical protein
MLTIHAPSSAGDAVAVRGDLIEAVGPRAELLARYPGSRVREWPGQLRPALVHTAPVPSAPTSRERVHALLRLGATAVLAEHLDDANLRNAVVRTGVRVLPAAVTVELLPAARADLAVFDADGVCVATVLAGRVVHRRA